MLAKLANLLSGNSKLQGECVDERCECGFYTICGWDPSEGRKVCFCTRIK